MFGGTPPLLPFPSVFFFLSVDREARVNSLSDPSPPIGAVRELLLGTKCYAQMLKVPAKANKET